MTDMNGKGLQPVGTSLKPESVDKAAARPEARKYCDTCVFSNLALTDDKATMICRRNPPTVVGAAALQKDGSVLWLTNVLWAGVSKMDWCGQHQPDPRSEKAGLTNDSVIAGA